MPKENKDQKLKTKAVSNIQMDKSRSRWHPPEITEWFIGVKSSSTKSAKHAHGVSSLKSQSNKEKASSSNSNRLFFKATFSSKRDV